MRSFVGVPLIVAALVASPVRAGTILLSANDGLQTFTDGAYKMRPHPGLGTLSAFELSAGSPQPLWQVPLEQTAVGPPTAIAVTPDGTLALVANPATIDPADLGKILRTSDLQVVVVAPNAPTGVAHVDLHHHPWSVAMAPDGRLAVTANGDGTVTLLRIVGADVTVIRDVPIGTSQSLDTGVAFSRDGRYVLVSRRHDDVVTLLRVGADDLTPVRDVTVGSNPYEIVMSADGRLAAVSNIGRNSGDADSVTLIDMADEPVHAVGVIPVGPTPEGLAFSPNSHWLAVNSINGSNLKRDDPFHRDHSVIQLFDIGSGPARLAGSVEVGPNAQGLSFTPNDETLIVQDYAADALTFFDVGRGGLRASGEVIHADGGPSALAVFVQPSSN